MINQGWNGKNVKIIGNIVACFLAQLDKSINSLLSNAENTLTIIHWTTVYQMAAIIKLKTDYNNYLIIEKLHRLIYGNKMFFLLNTSHLLHIPILLPKLSE